MKHYLSALLVIVFSIIVMDAIAQTATVSWPLSNKSTSTDTVSGCMSASAATYSSYLNSYGILYSSLYGFRFRQVLASPWPVAPTDSICADFRMNAVSGNDIKLDSITFKTCSKQATDNFLMDIYYQIDSSGKWIRATPAPFTFSTSLTPVASTIYLNKLPLYNGHYYKFRFYVYSGLSTGVAMSTLEYSCLQALKFYGNCYTPAIKPATTTFAASKIDKYSAFLAGTFDTAALYQRAIETGFCWSKSNTLPSFANSHQSYSAAYSDTVIGILTGLVPATTYYVRSYIITQLDTIYGNSISFITLPFTVPVLSTSTTYNIKSYKAYSGGYGNIGTANLIDSGGYNITQKGVVYLAAPVIPTTTLGNKGLANPLSGAASFTNCMLTNLLPNTKYYVRAFATNQLGTAYGNIDSFTTLPAAPAIAALPALIDFGSTIYNGSSPILSYLIKANSLPVGTDSIYVNFTAPFQLSLNPNGPFTMVSPLVIPCNSTGAPISKVVYIKLAVDQYGLFNGILTHSGTAVLSNNADTVNLTASVVQSNNLLTNLGTEFWAGFGYQQRMSSKPYGIDSLYGTSFYISSKAQSAVVTIDLPGFSTAQKAAFGFPKTYNISADSTIEVKGFPIGDINDPKDAATLPDTRLYYTGISNRGIHIISVNGVPVSVIQHIWANNNSAGATLLSPVSSLASKYIVQSYGGKTNTGPGNAFFYAIATQDSTNILFTPGGDILDSSTTSIFASPNIITTSNIKYHKGQNYYITLNKGQVFNAMSFLDATTSVASDLSGTVLQSIDSAKTIAVFGGNGRTLVDTSTANPPAYTTTSGSDNLLQQMLPSKLWGTKYLAVPTKTMEFNYYRIYVLDTTTIVQVNGIPFNHANLVNGCYYQMSGNGYYVFTANLPISVSQFIVSGNYTNPSLGNNGTGDPEMINLSPVNMGIKATLGYTTYFKVGTTGAAFVNVIIPKTGISTFSLNNKALVDTGGSSYVVGTPYIAGTLIPVANAFKVHPADSNYYFARFHLPYPATFSISSSDNFTGIVYGVSTGESYGYNLGYVYNANYIITPLDTLNMGRIFTPLGKPVSGATVYYPDSSHTTNSDSMGYYVVSTAYANNTVRFRKNNDINKTNGISTIDLALIQSHILGKTMFNSPYKIIAADVNGDGKVSTLDIVFIKRMILGLDTTFTKTVTGEKRLWAFVNSSVSFADSTNPFPYTDSVLLITPPSVMPNYPAVIGMKLGDVNWDWNPALARIPGKVFIKPRKKGEAIIQ